MKQALLQNLNSLRGDDNYPSSELKEKIIDIFFPENIVKLTQGLSNVTSAFYGLLLKSIGEEFGVEQIDKFSKKVFYELGKSKAQQAKAIYPEMPNDTRAFAIVIISAIYSSSPEYSFEIIKYTPDHTSIEMNGVDRYLRILTELGISKHVTFPIILPFMDGIKDFFNMNYSIDYDLEGMANENEAKCVYNFRKQKI